MAKLNAASRNALPSSQFAGPGRSYPIPDKGHAEAAESDASKFASPGTKARVDAEVHKKFPDMGKGVGLLGKRKSAKKKDEDEKKPKASGPAMLGQRGGW